MVKALKKGTRFEHPLYRAYHALYDAWGAQHWWPADTPLEMMVGAILTQNTAWTNVEKAIARLKEADALSLERLHRASLSRLAGWIRPSGYFNLKARRLRALTGMIFERYDGRLERLLAEPPDRLREVLLGVWGIGPETADSILLYAAGHAVFVVDTYTRRIVRRHGWLRGDESYDDVSAAFTSQIPSDPGFYGEFHALIVRAGKYHCRPRPDCASCPLRFLLPPNGPRD
jgi:endonuclease-3 related protein